MTVDEQFVTVVTGFNATAFEREYRRACTSGFLASKIFVLLYFDRKEWTTGEMAKELDNHRSNVHVSLRGLERSGLVRRVSRLTWCYRIYTKMV